jgi:hypothetical protein
MVLLANDPFLCFGAWWGVVSVNHDARRTGFGGCGTNWVGSGTLFSLSSSELDKASESGVAVLALSFSSRMVWLDGGTAGRPPWPCFEGVLGLIAAELIIQPSVSSRCQLKQ